MNALQRAEDEMRKAVSGHDASAQQRAAQQLAEAEALMKNGEHQQAGGTLSELAKQAEQIANRQREYCKATAAIVRRTARVGPSTQRQQ